MSKPTPKIGIFGGNEFQENCLDIDIQFCNSSPIYKAKVLILPTAAANENPDLATLNGINHFNKIGVDVSALKLITKKQSNDERFLRPINDSNVIYLTGGNPKYLNTILQNSKAITEIKKVLSCGSLLIGSSAGAMVMGEYMLLDKIVDGLNLIPNTIIVPHFENNNDIDNLLNISRNRDITILGLDSQAACIADNNNWFTLGNRKITIIENDNIQEFSQDKMKLPLEFHPIFQKE